ncbi:MAG: DUF1761 domain-containing protein [Novosphingobium sp.]
MGPVNWLAVILAVVAALFVAAMWYGPIFGHARRAMLGSGPLALTAGLLFLTSAMMGHMFARVGPATLSVKPWLYFMMSGGLALAFVIPALMISYTQQRVSRQVALIDAGFWLIAYLTMGLTFFLLRA